MARRSQRIRRQRRIERMKATEQEAKLSKVVEDNSVVLERMKPVETIEEKRDLSKMTKKELLVIANELGCNIKRTSTKATIVKAINEAQ